MKDSKIRIGTTILVIIALVVAFIIFQAHSKANNSVESVDDSLTQVSQEGWETTTTADSQTTFMYPADLGTRYITPSDWPPVLNVVNEQYSCTEAGSEIARAGKTQEVDVLGQKYCMTVESEGAAGSTYNQYAYVREAGDREEILTFTLRFVQCENYDDPQKTECKAERDSFDITTIIDKIFKSISRE
jgi:hypothetical protein